jgi:hypothetical protein
MGSTCADHRRRSPIQARAAAVLLQPLLFLTFLCSLLVPNLPSSSDTGLGPLGDVAGDGAGMMQMVLPGAAYMSGVCYLSWPLLLLLLSVVATGVYICLATFCTICVLQPLYGFCYESLRRVSGEVAFLLH